MGISYDVKCKNCGLTASVAEGTASERGCFSFDRADWIFYCSSCGKLHNMKHCPDCNKCSFCGKLHPKTISCPDSLKVRIEEMRIKPPMGLLYKYSHHEPAVGTTKCPKCGKETLVWELTGCWEA